MKIDDTYSEISKQFLPWKVDILLYKTIILKEIINKILKTNFIIFNLIIN